MSGWQSYEPSEKAGPGGFDHDVVVVGSGFGGSVTALRLTEKGYRVAVLEQGRRFRDDDFAKTSWDLRRFLWMPRLGLHGVQRIHWLKDVLVLAGSGVGGGSLNYANTLYVPPKAFFQDRQWGHITDWADELAPHYDQAARMLGVVQNPSVTPADEVMKAVADEMGVGHTFRLTPVGVFFGDGPGVESPDPFFGGAGPSRHGCTECGNCMVGCRHDAKNTLVKNYLHLAEKAGAQVVPDTEVVAVRPLPAGGYAVDVQRPGAWLGKERRTVTAEQVVLAASAYGTQRLLFRMREAGHLPALSARLGELSRSNSEAITGAITRRRGTHDFTRGVAITSSFYPTEDTHIEPCRYGAGSNAMGLLATVMTDGDTGRPRWREALRTAVKQPGYTLRTLSVRHWSERTIALLVMQTLDNSLTVHTKRGLLGRRRLTTKQGYGAPNPTWIPVANEAARVAAALVEGEPGGSLGDLVSAPMTAHFIGGCVIGDSPATGVVDPYQRVYGHPGLHIADGSAVSANLGVNPSLTITAQAERAMALWPNRGEADARPPLGAPYQRVAPVPPSAPVVPQSAPAALRLPLVEVRHGAAADRLGA
ncbi:MAG: GMC oxidoreductase [Motilibacteraceae bacterium]